MMKNICKQWWGGLAILMAAVAGADAQTLAPLQSPGGKLRAEVKVEASRVVIDLKDSRGRLAEVRTLQLDFDKQLVGNAWQADGEERAAANRSWQQPYGERAVVPDVYNSLSVKLKDGRDGKAATVALRLYDEGLAFRYGLDESDFWKRRLKAERTQFLFGADCTTWVTSRAQGAYSATTLSALKGEADRPQVVRVGDDRYVAVGEAALTDFARMKLKKADEGFGLQAALSGEVDLDLARYRSPWRYVMVAPHPGKLVENNYFLLNLNEPCRIENTAWIRPGQVLREVTLTTEGGLACVDFAAEHGIAYVEFDAGWYGPENDRKSDATTITVDTARSKGVLDLHRVIRHATERGVGIVLYVNRFALSQQLDEVFPLYRQWGVKGVKFGFVDVGDQMSTAWLHHAVRLAAKYELMVDIHDEYRPTGYSRTYPNLLTQEGIRGDEESPSLQQTLYTFYNRMIAGAGDYTNCYHDRRVTQKMGGKAAQLAKRVLLYSPWQFVYWYDRPKNSPARMGGAGGNENVIVPDEATRFYTSIPTVWDETRFLEGNMDTHAVVARRSGTDWYVAVVNAGAKRRIRLDPSLLDASEQYTCVCYGQKGGKADAVTVKEADVKTLCEKGWEVDENSGCVVHLRVKR